jgi:hypothetical protein
MYEVFPNRSAFVFSISDRFQLGSFADIRPRSVWHRASSSRLGCTGTIYENLLHIEGVVGTAVGLAEDGMPVVKIYTEKEGIGGLREISTVLRSCER